MSQTKRYQDEARQTEAPITVGVEERIGRHRMIRSLHAALGVTTEAGELADIFKKHVFYGKDVDRVNVIEELGDLLWYVALLANVTAINIEEIMAINVAKLRKRYPDRFTEEAARNRVLDAERETLEAGAETARLAAEADAEAEGG